VRHKQFLNWFQWDVDVDMVDNPNPWKWKINEKNPLYKRLMKSSLLPLQTSYYFLATYKIMVFNQVECGWHRSQVVVLTNLLNKYRPLTTYDFAICPSKADFHLYQVEFISTWSLWEERRCNIFWASKLLSQLYSIICRHTLLIRNLQRKVTYVLAPVPW
jgi:hypothetical protein